MPGRRVLHFAAFGWPLALMVLMWMSGRLSTPPTSRKADGGPLALSIAIIEQAQAFSMARVGEEASTPNEVLAWRVIFFCDQREDVFRRILTSGGTAGRLYALAGLWNTRDFTSAAAPLADRGDSVTTVRGCLVGQELVQDLVGEIGSGSWTRDFLSPGW